MKLGRRKAVTTTHRTSPSARECVLGILIVMSSLNLVLGPVFLPVILLVERPSLLHRVLRRLVIQNEILE